MDIETEIVVNEQGAPVDKKVGIFMCGKEKYWGRDAILYSMRTRKAVAIYQNGKVIPLKVAVETPPPIEVQKQPSPLPLGLPVSQLKPKARRKRRKAGRPRKPRKDVPTDVDANRVAQ